MTFSIGEVSEKLGIAASTIRYYETEGLIPPAVRKSGRRVYVKQDIETIRLVQMARTLGLGIEDIKAIKSPYTDRARDRRPLETFLHNLLSETDQKIERLRAQKEVLQDALRCECATQKQCELFA